MTPESEAEKELMAEFDSRFKGWEGGTIASVLNAEIAQMRDFLLTAYRKGCEKGRDESKKEILARLPKEKEIKLLEDTIGMDGFKKGFNAALKAVREAIETNEK